MKESFCYVVHPANDNHDWQLIFYTLIEPAAREAGFSECVLGAPTGAAGILIEDIVSALVEAELVVVDVTGCNDPDAFYQLGVRHARSNRTILIAQDHKHIQSVFMPYHSIIYSTQGLQAPTDFRKNFLEVVSKIRAEPEKPDNPVMRFIRRDVELREELEALRKQVAELERRLVDRTRSPITFTKVP